MKSNRVIFANSLRGIAAVLVVISHYAGIFWTMHSDIADEIGAPPLENFPSVPVGLSTIIDYSTLIGQLGVGVFFIISGLVIPFSFRNSTNKSFLKKRAMRIYPVYIVGFCITMLSLYSLSAYLGHPYKFAIGDILAHFGVITRAPLGVTRIDGVSWTLEVEIYFYLAMVVFGTRALELDFKRYVVLSVIIFILSAFTFRMHGNLNGAQVACGLLLLLGVSYYSNLNGKISRGELRAMQIIASLLISLLWLCFANRTSHTFQWFGAYLLAIALFCGCFMLRDRFRENRVLSHFSSISYPLYVVHAVLGYVILYVLLKNGIGVYSSIALTTLATYIVALFIHLLVEIPSLRWIAIHRECNGRQVPSCRTE